LSIYFANIGLSDGDMRMIPYDH